MLTKEFNNLPLATRSKLVYDKGSLVAIFSDDKAQKGFYYTLNNLKIDLIYDKVRNRLLDVIAWDNSSDRTFLVRNVVVS
jgi:hypothetical protein